MEIEVNGKKAVIELYTVAGTVYHMLAATRRIPLRSPPNVGWRPS